MTPIRHISVPRGEVTLSGELPRGTWRYSSRLALVLSGGGARAAYQVGVLAGLAERLSGLEFPILSGVSAGAIGTSFLAAHPGPLPQAVADLRVQWGRLTSEQVYRVRPLQLVGSAGRWLWQGISARRRGPTPIRGLLDTGPLREFLGRTMELSGIDIRLASGALRAVALTATSYTTGRSVTFVHGGPNTLAWERALRMAVSARLTLDHVMASAALPLLFPSVRIGDEFYGDGSVIQLAPLAPALHLGARAIVAIGTPMVRDPQRILATGDYPSAAEVLGLLFRAIFLDALEGDAERLERVNQLLEALPPGTPAPGGLRPVELLLIRPSRNLGDLAVGSSHLLPPSVRSAVRAIGGRRAEASEFLSYLLFHPTYTSRLIEVGYDDVGLQWPLIERFFAKLERSGPQPN